MGFKVGDRVRIVDLTEVDERDTDLKIGDIGTLVGDGPGKNCSVRFDEEKIKNKAINWDYKLKAYVMFEDQIEKVEDVGMTKKDLKDGMVCEVRCGKRYIWLYGDLRGIDSWRSKTQEDLTNLHVADFDIVKIYDRGDNNTIHKILVRPGELIWERKEPREMTVTEIEKALGYRVKVVK